MTELFHRDNNDIISSQRGTGGHDEFAITIMLHTRIKGVSRPRNLFRLMFYGHAIFKGNSQKEARYLSSPVYRCRETVKNSEKPTRFKIEADILITYAGEFFTEEIEDTESL